ncbi:MAG: 2,3-bisphosphoglycerate-independent phosphoglycerate mutase, partial [Planctomycetota bacterium]
MPTTTPTNAPLVLIIRDGWGENPHSEHDAFNAVKLAKAPVTDRLMAEWPSTLIHTCGEDVGLSPGIMGNSEVGHQNIGAGRIVDQESLRITRAIRDGSSFDNRGLRRAFEHTRSTGGRVHLLGLVSDGQVHSDLEHLYALVDLAARLEFPGERLLVHAITDGRDTAPKAGLGFVEQVEKRLEGGERGRIASVMGRYYAMDRDHRWDRVALAFSCLTGRSVTVRSAETKDLSVRAAGSAREAVETYYRQPTEPSRSGDEFIVPTRIESPGTNAATVNDGDAVIFFNYRGDRPRELTKAFVLDDKQWSEVKKGGFERGRCFDDLFFCTMTAYEEGLPVSAVAFEKPPKLKNILGQVIADAGLTQFRCAETEKFPHVTFFFNDYREQPFDGEERLLVPSPRDVSTYDQKPQMSAYEVCDGVVERLAGGDDALVVVNFANGDMVGHTGNLEAAVRAIEVTDECVGRIVEAALQRGGSLIVTADHGNAEQMWDPAHDCPHTAHT